MGWAYAIKGTINHFGSKRTYYLRRDGRILGGLSEARQFDTRENAEAKAMSIIAKHPELVGNLEVVRCPDSI